MERAATLQANECVGQQVVAPIYFFACFMQPLFEYTQLTPARSGSTLLSSFSELLTSRVFTCNVDRLMQLVGSLLLHFSSLF